MPNLSTPEMRKALIAMYPNGTKWRLKVNKMQDSQVLAIYLRKVLNRDNAVDKR